MDAIGWSAVVVIGGVCGWINQAKLLKKAYPGQLWGALIAGIVGAWIGGGLFGVWGFMFAGVNVIGSIIAALVLSYVIGMFGQEEVFKDQSKGT